MSDAAIANLVTGLVTTVTLVFGFLTLWVKLKYGVERTVTTAAANTWSQGYKLEKKLDANTAVTNTVNAKANTIVEQTNGAAEKMRALVEGISERVAKIEEYNHESTHKLANAVNALHLKVAAIVAIYHPELNNPPPAAMEGKQ